MSYETESPEYRASVEAEFDRKELIRLRAENEMMREALNQSAEWFQGYADGHTAKGDTDKARRNQNRADFCRKALDGGE